VTTRACRHGGLTTACGGRRFAPPLMLSVRLEASVSKQKAVPWLLILPQVAIAISGFAADPDVQVEDRLVVNTKANYHFTLPTDWVVKDPIDYQHLTLCLPGSTVTVTLRYDLASEDGNPLVMALVSALGAETSDFRPDGLAGISHLGGQVAVELRGMRTGKVGGKEKVRFLATERDEYTLTITSAVAEDEAQKADGQIDQIVRTFAFGKPPKKKR